MWEAVLLLLSPWALLLLAAFVIMSIERSIKCVDINSFSDKYENIEQVQEALRSAGLETSNLILGIDYTASNNVQGARSFGGKCLHAISIDDYNPYQRVIKFIGETLEKFDEDRLIPAFGFGDIITKDTDVFPFLPDPTVPRYCQGVEEVLSVYTHITPGIQLAGPTNFAPLIYRSIDVLFGENDRSSYHILVIIADGQVCNEKETQEAIVEASKYPLSIIMVGVGDGPWESMETYDDELPTRRFDNFQFVNYNTVMNRAKYNAMKVRATSSYRAQQIAFSVAALMEIPDQFKAIKKLNLLNKSRQELSSYPIPNFY